MQKQKRYIQNPILTGFNPDPSIVRVGDDYYIATSTFEWFPGVQIHHSRDLINWKLVAHPLNRVSQLDLKGVQNSFGVWAPCLSYDNGKFFLIYTIVNNFGGPFKDTHNYVVTSRTIDGEWSEPIYLNSSGFDPSLFHDDDGRKWLVNMTWDYRGKKSKFGGIIMQEYCEKEKKLIGDVTVLFNGSGLKSTEGPHLYKVNGYYYLITAEGGTGYNHCVTMARSKTLHGPYEVDPKNPMLTSKENPDLYLQKAGHADLVQTQNGDWYMVHLCSRPLKDTRRCILGRETAIQKVVWNSEGWLELEGGGNQPFDKVPAPDLQEYPYIEEYRRDNFDSTELDINFQTLRVPLGEDSLSLTERPGYLRLKGRESLSSYHTQCLVARRQQHFDYVATTCVEFEPENYKQMAGLICYYDTKAFYYMLISKDEDVGKSIRLIQANEDGISDANEDIVCIEGLTRCYLRATVNHDKLQFSYSADGEIFKPVGGALDASILSDDYQKGFNFTGAFVGLCCQDLSGERNYADFDWFEYMPL